MEVQLINTVILAENYEELVTWYKETLELDIKLQADKDYHYTDLVKNNKLIVGICPASEMKHIPTAPRNNSVVLQISVDDIEILFSKVADNGGSITFGPAMDKNEGFKFGGFKDPEGNHVWVMENFNFS
jgi:predicted enzyme related to lactoylglutathione lyase